MRVAAIIIKDSKILLLRRLKDGLEYFVFPGGGVEDDESLEEAAKREIKEELGIDIVLDRLAFQLNNRGDKESYFLVKEFSGIPEWIEKEKFTENNQYYPVWLDLKNAVNLENLFPEEARDKLNNLDFIFDS